MLNKKDIMKKGISIIILMLGLSIYGFSQEQEKELPKLNQRDSAVPVNLHVVPADKIKKVELSKPQKKQVKKYKRSRKKTVVKTTTSLTPEQKKKMVENNKVEPRRGVTNLPNERTVNKN